eukprot:TRINITY_DN33756_c0_g1_i1.p2 TRINITY_DN33756_c0_g1~~TRINITY_DN33756_c0_g1_i1.p2  ORF type:complete len:223 (+),score=44.38 TRINITY_DN33756_c0_g1_i1:94-762(+)
MDSDGESSGSSANEYAEGLGCRGRKRCRMAAESGFEFDNRPSEEYFSEPKGYREDDDLLNAVGHDAPMPASRDSKRRRGDGRSAAQLSGLLGDLEDAEAAGLAREAEMDRQRQQCFEEQMARLDRRCERRAALRENGEGKQRQTKQSAEEAAVCRALLPIKSASSSATCSKRPDDRTSGHVQLQRLAADLCGIRHKMKRGRNTEADVRLAVGLFEQLGAVRD